MTRSPFARTPVRLHIACPQGANWFYRRVAADLQEDLAAEGMPATVLPASPAMRVPAGQGGTVLLVNPSECLFAVGSDQGREALRASWASYTRRVLVCYDSLHTPWFANQFRDTGNLITHVADVGMLPQTEAAVVRGCPYAWIPESFTHGQASRLQPWTEKRPLPWAILGHGTMERAVLLYAAMRRLGPHGFAFLPQLRPYGAGHASLDEAQVARLLSRTDLYLWSSHHPFPYHEGFRALDAIAHGAVPAKIESLFADRMRGLPWVFPDFDALIARIAQDGLCGLHKACRDHVLSQGFLGQHVAALLRSWEAA